MTDRDQGTVNGGEVGQRLRRRLRAKRLLPLVRWAHRPGFGIWGWSLWAAGYRRRHGVMADLQSRPGAMLGG